MKLTPRFEDALVYATRLHAGQTRKASDTPYIAHLLAVTALVLEHGGDEDEVVAALLHDAVEDQGGPPVRAEISRLFGEPVARIVDGCTDTDQTPKPPWRQRKEAFIASTAVAPNPVRLVVAADKLHNARSVLADYRWLGETVWDRFHGRRAGTLWYYRAITDALIAGGITPLIDELDRTVTALEHLAASTTAASEGAPNGQG